MQVVDVWNGEGGGRRGVGIGLGSMGDAAPPVAIEHLPFPRE